MRILVVRTCDGPVYFSARRSTSKLKAVDMAAEQVLENDKHSYDNADKALVKSHLDNGNWKQLYQALVTVGAITEANVRE